MPLLLLLFIAVPIAEIALFIEVGDWIGLWPTIATILVTALIGTTLVRQQGLAALERARTALAEDRLPVAEVLTGACLLVAGALLLTPGFLTDAIGLTLLIPPLRNAIGRAVAGYAARNGRFTVHTTGGGHPGGMGGHPGGGPGPRRGRGGAPIIEGDYVEVDPDSPDPGDPPHDGGHTDPDRGSGR
ncbi:FxsA family protein [Marivibrio halodurans]|uniref:FxsA family protein n=1 Tax=Marivibrio halodurans TaxID=2039722 RepID=A0A8J7V4X5_9PROT|nr:FxsA family protein [Marivibrio halodurans]MBP5858169.1 FxsA family protein [Marivibrio halodurans]